jgi:hypothetical protein
MIKGSVVITCAFAIGFAACASSDPNDAHSMTDARVPTADASQDASGGRSDAGPVEIDAGNGGRDAADASKDASGSRSDAGPVEIDAGNGGRDASTGGPKDAGATRDASADASCPPECLRAYTCAPSCSAPAFDNGCCPCPPGAIDIVTCNPQHGGCGTGAPGCGEQGAACCDPWPCDGPNFCHGALKCCGATCAASCADAGGGGGYCTVPCTGAAPFPSVVQACQAIPGEGACQAYQATDFPYGCRWVTPATAGCPALP